MEKRITIALYLVILISGIFVFRLWHLQILRGNDYRKIDERNRQRVLNILPPRGIIYDRNGKPLVKNIPSFDISVVKEDLPKDPETVAALARLIGLTQDEIITKLKSKSIKPFEPLTLKEDVSFEEVAKVEARKIDFPGLQIKVVGGREYTYGHSASHVLGYLGSMSMEQMRAPDYRGVPVVSVIGQFGIEKVYDSTLRGIAGKKVIEVDAVGSIMKVVRIQRPIKGSDIKLTIDIDLQVEAEKNLRDKAGAVVALKPNTGEVLALASSPAFDPNLFVRGINSREWQKLVKDPRKPLLNRAIQSQYPPGSTFKIITAIAALEEGIVSQYTEAYCNGSIYFGRVFRCWKWAGHGDVRLRKAIVESCDVYFYEIGKKIDIDTLGQYAFSYGLGRRTGIDLEGEVPGIVPTSGWKRKTRKENWYTGETLNTVIGQGYLSATPIQMARVMATVVNGGKLYQPVLLMGSRPRAKAEGVIKVGDETLTLIKESLRAVVTDKHGTGRQSDSDLVEIAGKTGTTQVVGGLMKEKDLPLKFRDHAWFVAFAPMDNPQIAVAVFVEHGGHGGTGAAPIAKKIIEAYFKENRKLDMDSES
jgi:penicillin-binding protein 2